MKTPREILLEHHRAAELKLDTVRQAVVGELSSQTTRKPRSLNGLADWFLGYSSNIWRELIWPSRHIWAGLAAVWILILVANVSMQDHSQLATAKSLPAPEIIMTWRQQERLLAELVGPDEMRAAPPPKPFLPRPSSERRLEILMA